MKYVIIGGTGTLGSELVRQLRHIGQTDITVLSRDECKQQSMVREYPGTRFVIGDVRDMESVRRAVQGANSVFHVAAMKHIDVVEKNPEEAVKTNILGTMNVARACQAEGVRHMVFSSTDKAVHPVNTYGHTKAIGERFLLGLNGDGPTKFSVYRWGNVLGSRGSAIHVFAESLKMRNVIPITDPKMTRFWIHIEDAVRFMLGTFKTAHAHKPMIPEMKAAPVLEMAKAVGYVLGKSGFDYERIGIRKGEKLHEEIDAGLSSNNCAQYTPKELAEMARRVL